MQQTPVDQVHKVAEECKRVLKPGGKALFLDLAWKKATINNPTLELLMDKFMYELGNPVVNPDASEHTPEVLRRAGFTDVKQEFSYVASGIKEKYLFLTGVTRVASELHEKGLISQKRLDEVVYTVDSAYSYNDDIELVMPVSYTIGTAPS